MIEIKKVGYLIRGWHLPNTPLFTVSSKGLKCSLGKAITGGQVIRFYYQSEEEFIVDMGGLLKLYFPEEPQTWLL